MQLLIKNMVCNRCILVVRQELEKLNMLPALVTMGEIQFTEPPSTQQLRLLNENLRSLGFEILDDQRQKQIEKIKTELIKKIQSGELEEHFSISKFLSKTLNREYSYISHLFSEVEGITVEQFFIMQKLEKVKELIIYNEMNLSEIAFRLGYSSVAHLSAQFKKMTGLTPSHFRKVGLAQRKSIDALSSSK
jgi:AraC family transcriptional regulator